MTIWLKLLLGTLYSALSALFLTKADALSSCLKYGFKNYWRNSYLMWLCCVGVFVCAVMLIALVFA